jgi:aryl-alcohol dehydrogenase-like predicted oxidoreductase
MNVSKRRLGNSELSITPVGIGTAPIGSTPDWSIYWGPQDERDAIRAIDTAIDLGINWIDTAPFYGWGRAEQLVGKAIQKKREKVYLFTKCGTLRTGDGSWYESLQPGSIKQEIEVSLRNLRTDRIDLYQFHDPDPRTPIEESLAAVQQLIQEGKVRYAGLSNHPCELIQRAAAAAEVVSIQCQYNMFERSIEKDILPCSSELGIGLLAWSPLASGFLADDFELDTLHPDDFRRQRPLGQLPLFTHVQKVRGVVQSIAQAHNKRMVDVAIAWILQHNSVTAAIVGIRNEKEAREMLGGAMWQLPEPELKRLDEIL